MARKQTDITTTSLQELVEQANERKEQSPPQKGLCGDYLARLEHMSRGESINLIRCLPSTQIEYSLLTEPERAERAKMKLYSLGMDSTEVYKVVPSLEKWFDRTSGKAPQFIAMTVKDEGMSKIATDNLIRLAAMLDDPILIAPMPKKIDDDTIY